MEEKEEFQGFEGLFCCALPRLLTFLARGEHGIRGDAPLRGAGLALEVYESPLVALVLPWGRVVAWAGGVDKHEDIKEGLVTIVWEKVINSTVCDTIGLHIEGSCNTDAA